MMPTPTAAGPARDCLRKRNGRRRHVDQTGGSFPGAMMGQPAKPPILENAATGKDMRFWLQWAAWKPGKAHMDFTTWQGMSTNGFQTGMARIITALVRLEIPRALQQESIRSYAADHGIRQPSMISGPPFA